MSDGDSLLRAILDRPDDDAPRLVYADYLDEQGDGPRAEFIRTQVRLARLPSADPDRSRLLRVERALLRAHRGAWAAWVPRWVSAWEFRRGFLEWVRCEASAFLAGADELRSRTPLAGVRLDGKSHLAVAVFRSRALDGLRSLTLSIILPAGVWEHLAACPYLGQLTDLDLSSNDMFPAELVRGLIWARGLRSLTALRLKWCMLGDEQAARLVGNPWVTRLRLLDLSNNYLGAEGAAALAESPYLDGLQTLVVRGNPGLTTGRAGDDLRKRFGPRLCL